MAFFTATRARWLEPVVRAAVQGRWRARVRSAARRVRRGSRRSGRGRTSRRPRRVPVEVTQPSPVGREGLLVEELRRVRIGDAGAADQVQRGDGQTWPAHQLPEVAESAQRPQRCRVAPRPDQPETARIGCRWTPAGYGRSRLRAGTGWTPRTRAGHATTVRRGARRSPARGPGAAGGVRVAEQPPRPGRGCRR